MKGKRYFWSTALLTGFGLALLLYAGNARASNLERVIESLETAADAGTHGATAHADAAGYLQQLGGIETYAADGTPYPGSFLMDTRQGGEILLVRHGWSPDDAALDAPAPSAGDDGGSRTGER